MIKIFLLFILPFSLYASKILSYNIYDRTDRTDVMITFDLPYTGVIKKSQNNSKIIIKLEGSSIESSKLKQISSEYIKTLAITPLSNYVQLVASVSEGIVLKVSKTSDSYGLRLRFQKNIPSTQASQTLTSTKKTSDLSRLPTKQTGDMSQSYYVVIGILIVGIIILLVVKKRITLSKTPNNTQPTIQASNTPTGIDEITKKMDAQVSIRFQKNIDEQNSVVMLDFLEQSYLVMMGKNNVLLDRFSEDKPSSQEEFNIILQDHQQALDGFLSTPSEDENAVKTYSQKASSISYDV